MCLVARSKPPIAFNGANRANHVMNGVPSEAFPPRSTRIDTVKRQSANVMLVNHLSFVGQCRLDPAILRQHITIRLGRVTFNGFHHRIRPRTTSVLSRRDHAPLRRFELELGHPPGNSTHVPHTKAKVSRRSVRELVQPVTRAPRNHPPLQLLVRH
jgi:hypothetical protein